MKANSVSKNLLIGAVAGTTFFGMLGQARANLTVYDKDWKFSVGGFIEADSITDSTRSFREVVGNAPVAAKGTSNGDNGREQFSIRNSRLDFTLEAPEQDGIRSKAYFEFDFLGFNPSPGTANNTEFNLYNSPTPRIRHAYLQAGNEGFQVLAGQYWNLLGWQPYYFMTTADFSPLPGMLYARTAQLRGLKTVKFSDEDQLQAAIAVVRPPQADSRYPALEGGLRMAFGERKSGLTGAASGARVTQPMSIAVSGTLREFAISSNDGVDSDLTHYTGAAFAVDGMLPVLASSDGKQVGNTLSLLAEFTDGTGYGDEFSNWTGNLPNPLSTASVAGPTKTVAPNLDAGLGDYDYNGVFQLVHLRQFNVHAQYHLPEELTSWIDVGYAQLFSNNIANLVVAGTNKTSAGLIPYNREQVAFANFFHEFTPQLRAAVEYARIQTSYADSSSGIDHRVQISGYFIF